MTKKRKNKFLTYMVIVVGLLTGISLMAKEKEKLNAKQ